MEKPLSRQSEFARTASMRVATCPTFWYSLSESTARVGGHQPGGGPSLGLRTRSAASNFGRLSVS